MAEKLQVKFYIFIFTSAYLYVTAFFSILWLHMVIFQSLIIQNIG